ncbi:unnamed protein product [Microthlaspi erraticum]|uniref:DUF4218 domain-containing protein n=1 Tax=Microthlaspi erraticum TaxID=1685480 RepID=A0A6D2JZX8_9BRAS|nr:unnamed protein product [Microthlaspi erraticum]
MGHKEHGGTWHMEAAQLDTQRKKGEAILKTSSTVHSTNRSSSSTRPAKLQLDRAGKGEDKKKDEFLAKIADAETPLHPTCVNHNKLSAIVSLFRLKTQNGWSDKSFNDLLETLPGMLPADNVLHTSLYEVKKFLKSFDMGYEKIHACVNDCCLFRKKYKKLENCPKCKVLRWKTNIHTGEVKQVTWDQMNAKYPSFATEERNVRLGLSTYGFNPFNMKNNMYSYWPVLLVNYNLPPDLCIKKENIMLTLLIPGPHQPGNSIDVYLEPLIEDLNHLWNNGEVTYDAFSKSTFTLKAMLLWTISDFPAYGNLAGCKVKGKMGCPLCGKNTDCMWLKFSRKHNLRNFKNEFGNLKRSGRKRKKLVCTSVGSEVKDLSSELEEEEEEELQVNEEELLRWKKKSIFFKLPYWEELPVRHNLDVMHVERNVAASIVATLLHCGKSKDGLQARKDLEELGIRKDLHPTIQGKRTYLPAAPWSLSKTEKKIFCRRLFDFKGPDGYCSIISRGRKARLGGPVHFRWKYPFERYMKILKDFFKNPARPEGCIAESYLAEECIQFCSDFLRNTTSVQEKQYRNTEYEKVFILEGRPIYAGSPVVEPYVE